MTRRWRSGTRTVIGGVTYQVVRGKKASRTEGSDDLRLEAWTPKGWLPVPMAAGAFMADFFYENEEVLFPPALGFAGGSYYVTYLKQAITEGWEAADVRLQVERRAREQRADRPVTSIGHTPMDEDDDDLDAAWVRAQLRLGLGTEAPKVA